MPQKVKLYSGRRDLRFVTVRRGGRLDDHTHHALAMWAADCAEHVLDLFEQQRPGDTRPAEAITAARRWARQEMSMMASRDAAFAAHAAARDATGTAREAARSAGHAVATAHMADHQLGVAFYALRAVDLAKPADPVAIERERQWQIDRLPDDIKTLVLDDMRLRTKKFRGIFGQA